MIVYSKEIAIAGTIDVLMMDKKSGDYVLIDWKTSKKIDKTSFNGKKGIKKKHVILMTVSIIITPYSYLYIGIFLKNIMTYQLQGNW